MPDIQFTPTNGNGVIYVRRESDIPENPDPSVVYMIWDGVDYRNAVRYEVNGGSIEAKGEIILDSSTSGDDSGWIPSSLYPERFGVLLTGSSAVVSITGSDDASSIAAGYAVTITMDTAASTLVTPPMNFDYKFIKFTVMSLGASSSIKVSRGV